MKFYLLLYGEAADPNTLLVFDNPAARDTETILRIFGADLTTQDEAEQWDKMRSELMERGVLTFEGDPGLEWFQAVAGN